MIGGDGSTGQCRAYVTGKVVGTLHRSHPKEGYNEDLVDYSHSGWCRSQHQARVYSAHATTLCSSTELSRAHIPGKVSTSLHVYSGRLRRQRYWLFIALGFMRGCVHVSRLPSAGHSFSISCSIHNRSFVSDVAVNLDIDLFREVMMHSPGWGPCLHHFTSKRLQSACFGRDAAFNLPATIKHCRTN